jgi:hypothetical protein
MDSDDNIDSEDQGQYPCPDCGHVHLYKEDVLDILLSRPNFTVSDELKGSQSQNDEFWKEQFVGGPASADIVINDDDSIDDIVTSYTSEWFNAVHTLNNMILILGKIVEKYNIVSGDNNPNLPAGISQIFSTGNFILNAEKAIYDTKSALLRIEKIRKDWGSIDAYVNAPESECTAWNEANRDNELANCMDLVIGGGGEQASHGLAMLTNMLNTPEILLNQ